MLLGSSIEADAFQRFFALALTPLALDNWLAGALPSRRSPHLQHRPHQYHHG